MKTEQEKNPIGKLDGIKTGWRLIVRCLQFSPVFIGFGAFFCLFYSFTQDLSTPKTLAYMLSDDWLWWHRHSELFFGLFYGGMFILFGIVLRFMAFVMKRYPDVFRKEDRDIQPAIDEVVRFSNGSLIVLVWIGLAGILYFFVGV